MRGATCDTVWCEGNDEESDLGDALEDGAMIGKPIDAEMLRMLEAQVTQEVREELKLNQGRCEPAEVGDGSSEEMPLHSDFCDEYLDSDGRWKSGEKNKTQALGKPTVTPQVSQTTSKEHMYYKWPNTDGTWQDGVYKSGRAFELPPFNAKRAMENSAWYNRQWAKSAGSKWCTGFLREEITVPGLATLKARYAVQGKGFVANIPFSDHNSIRVDYQGHKAGDISKSASKEKEKIKQCKDPQPRLVEPGACSHGGDSKNNVLGKCDKSGGVRGLPANPLCASQIWQTVFGKNRTEDGQDKWGRNEVSDWCKKSYAGAQRYGVHAISTTEGETPDLFICSSWAATCSMAPYPKIGLCRTKQQQTKNQKGEGPWFYESTGGDWRDGQKAWVDVHKGGNTKGESGARAQCESRDGDVGQPKVPAECATHRMVLGCWQRPKGWNPNTNLKDVPEDIEFVPCTKKMAAAQVFA